MMIDTIYSVELPEGVDLHLHPAGPLVRSLAWCIDSLLRAVIYTAAMILFLSLSSAITPQLLFGVMSVGLFLLEWFYPIFFECVNRGATPGKQWVGIEVVQSNGAPVTLSASIIRNFLRTADFFPLLYFTGLLSMLVDARFRRLGDMAADTLVVYRAKPNRAPFENQERGVELESDALPEQTLNTSSKIATLPLTQAEQQWLVHFEEAHPHLSLARQIELAELLSPLTGVSGEEAVNELHQWARQWKGQR